MATGTYAAVYLAAAGLAAQSAPVPVVEGDAEALKLVAAAVETAAAGLTRGQASFRGRQRHDDREIRVERMVWDGENCFMQFHYTQTYFSADENGNLGEEQKVLVGPCRLVTTGPDFTAMFHADFGRASITRAGGRRQSLLDVQPNVSWMRFGGPALPAAAFELRNFLKVGEPNGTVRRFVTSRDGDEITIAMHLHASAAVWTVTASLASGGLPVSYQSAGEEAAECRGEFEWARTPGGGWRPQRMRWQFFKTDDPSEAVNDFEIVVDSFRPDLPAEKVPFTLEALELAKGTEIHETSADGKVKARWYGMAGRPAGSSGGVTEGLLNELGDEAGESGFASPQR